MKHIVLEGVTDLPPVAWSQIAASYDVPETWVERTARLLADPISGLAERASTGGAREDEREALGALYLATITRECQPILERSGRHWLGPVNEMLGIWQIGFAQDDGMVDDDHSATLILRTDGSFSWDPPPEWLGGSGTWGLELMEGGQPKLRFESRDRRWSHFLVLHTMEDVGTFFHWQRTHAGMVVFKDRILRGHLLGTGE